MAGSGERVTFHGAFRNRSDAERRAEARGGYVKRIRVRGQTRYAVIRER